MPHRLSSARARLAGTCIAVSTSAAATPRSSARASSTTSMTGLISRRAWRCRRPWWREMATRACRRPIPAQRLSTASSPPIAAMAWSWESMSPSPTPPSSATVATASTTRTIASRWPIPSSPGTPPAIATSPAARSAAGTTSPATRPARVSAGPAISSAPTRCWARSLPWLPTACRAFRSCPAVPPSMRARIARSTTCAARPARLGQPAISALSSARLTTAV